MTGIREGATLPIPEAVSVILTGGQIPDVIPTVEMVISDETTETGRMTGDTNKKRALPLFY